MCWLKSGIAAGDELRNFLFRWAKKLIYPHDFVRDAGRGLVKYYYQLMRSEPVKIADLEWDNLIVLDACRFDAFEYENNIRGQLSKITSAGPDTLEWLYENFKGRRMKDTVYISANPFASNYCFRYGYPKHSQFKIGYNPFYKVIDVWMFGWSDELGTVHPRQVNKATLETHKKLPRKKLIVHYMQPHQPFIGDVKIHAESWRKIRNLALGKTPPEMKKDAWRMLKEKMIPRETVIKAYLCNLKLVLRYVKDLIPHLDGKICITSDHGNLFGKYGFVAHPRGVYCPDLVSVPLLEVAE